MSKDPPVVTRPAVPKRCSDVDVAVTDCKTAVIFSDKTPSFRAAKAASAGTADLLCDFKAVWAFVPPPPPDALSVLMFFHGNSNWVRVDSRGDCVLPDWSQKNDDIVTGDRDNPLALPVRCAPKHFGLAAAADANQKPIVLVPEVTDPAGKNHTVTVGGFKKKADLGDLVDECLQHLSDVSLLKKDSGCGGGPYLSKKPALPDIKRFFLSGHSGGGFPLFSAAISDLINGVASDVCLLDCTYGWQSVDHLRYIEYCGAKRTNLGNAAGQSRLLCFYGVSPIRNEASSKSVIRQRIQEDNEKNQAFNDKLAATNEARAAKRLPPLNAKTIIDPITDQDVHERWVHDYHKSTEYHAENDIFLGLKRAGFTFDEALPLSGAARKNGIHLSNAKMTEIEPACTLYPIVFAAVPVPHDSIPGTFIPIMLKTAKVV